MSAIGVTEAAGEALDHLGAWTPEDGEDAARMCRVLPQVIRSLAAALGSLADLYRDGPFDRQIADMLDELAKGEHTVAGYADELGPAFERLHEQQLNRLRHPRPGESTWNTPGL